MSANRRVTVVARTADLPFVTSLVQHHGSLYRAAAALPRVADLEGRGLAIAAEFGGEAWVVRHYKRGGAVARVLNDRYLRLGAPRPLQELSASEAVRARGVPTPQVKAACWSARGVFRRHDIATAYLPESEDLAEALFSAADPSSAATAAAALMRQMITTGVLHRDLNLKNILISRGSAYLLDLDRCEVVDRLTSAQVTRMRKRFSRSLQKWEARTGLTVNRALKKTLAAAFDG